jgi:hypothetical protein
MTASEEFAFNMGFQYAELGGFREFSHQFDGFRRDLFELDTHDCMETGIDMSYYKGFDTYLRIEKSVKVMKDVDFSGIPTIEPKIDLFKDAGIPKRNSNIYYETD